MPPEYVPKRQRNKIPPEQWAAILAEREEERVQLEAKVEAIEKEIARIERRYHAIRQPMIAGYIRCSHEDSKNSGLGEAAQRTLCERWAEFVRADNPQLPAQVTWYEEPEAVSAYSKQLRHRPAGRRLFTELCRGDHVIFAYLNRAFRNTIDCLDTLRMFKRRGVAVHFANMRVDMSSPIGEIIITVIAALAQMDSAMKSEYTKAALAELHRQGRMRDGHAPLGFRLTGRRGDKRRAMVPDLEQRRIMAEIVRVRDKHGWMWVEIAPYIEKWVADKEGRKPRPPWVRRCWTCRRVRLAYDAEKALRNGNSNATSSSPVPPPVAS